MNTNEIDNLILDLKEALSISNVFDRMEKFLNLLPNEDIIKLLSEEKKLTEKQTNQLNEILLEITPFLEDYESYLLEEKNKNKILESYIY